MADDRNRSKQIEARLEEWGVPYEYVEDFDLTDVDAKEYSQVRAATNRAPKQNVEQYALQMSHGAEFPPIVVAANDHSIIDGNTRVAAARANGYNSLSAYVVKPADQDMARIIGSTFNQFGGERLTGDELQEAAKAYLSRRFSDIEIARCLGRTAEWARKFRKRSEFAERVGEHKAAAAIKPTVAERLADIHQDAALATVMNAVAEDKLRLDVATAAKLVDAARDTHSDQAAVAAVSEAIAAFVPTDQGRSVSATRDRGNTALRSAIKQCGRHVEQDRKLIAVLAELSLPLVEPAASEYRRVLADLAESTEHLRATVQDLSGRLPDANAHAA